VGWAARLAVACLAMMESKGKGEKGVLRFDAFVFNNNENKGVGLVGRLSLIPPKITCAVVGS
jgi:hypothetical protein